jgi:hypothetical protein
MEIGYWLTAFFNEEQFPDETSVNLEILKAPPWTLHD